LILQVTKEICADLRDSFATLQKSHFKLDHEDLSEEEFHMINMYPMVWIMDVCSDGGNKEIMELLRLVSITPPPNPSAEQVQPQPNLVAEQVQQQPNPVAEHVQPPPQTHQAEPTTSIITIE